ncbi:MAG: YihY family inner membrane protein [Campylobacterota bacterium]|nr:YihY family inner membrane protein [Campylobacterota bacterium]
MQSRTRHLGRHLLFFIKKLFDAELTYYASSLSFYTIFTIIPLLLIILTLLTNTPSFIEYYETIKSFILDNLMPVHSEAVTEYIDSFLQNSVRLGVFGTVMVFVASMLFFDNYEYIVSKIFHIKQRTIWESITTYWTLLTLTPIGLVAFFYLSVQASTFLTEHEVSGWFNPMAIFPYLIIWGLLFVIYLISANTKVNKKAAAITSFVIALIWNLTKLGFVYYVFYNKTYATLYGSFSILIFFFLWIYVSWIIFVYGLRLCYLINRVYKYREHYAKQRD